MNEFNGIFTHSSTAYVIIGALTADNLPLESLNFIHRSVLMPIGSMTSIGSI